MRYCLLVLHWRRFPGGDAGPGSAGVEVSGRREAVVSGSSIETESKHRVLDLTRVVERLRDLGYEQSPPMLHTDEYYDNSAGGLLAADLVVRLRVYADEAHVAIKGHLERHPDGASSRREVEWIASSAEDVRRGLDLVGLSCRRRLEKLRVEFAGAGRPDVLIDDIPAAGLYLEVEGPLPAIRDTLDRLGESVGPAEWRNAFELAQAAHAARTTSADAVMISFASAEAVESPLRRLPR